MTNARSMALVLCAVAPALAFAQPTEKVLKGKEVTESNLIEALTPEEGVRTRSIKIMREGGTPQAPAKPAAASLLITFETNSAELTPRAKQSLDVVGRALTSNKLADFKFSIEGHADPRGEDARNLDLSQARAESVVNYLAENFKIDRSRLKPIGKGETELMNTANPAAPENRRVTIKTVVE